MKTSWDIAARSLLIFLPLAALLASVTAWIYLNDARDERTKLEKAETGAMTFLSNTVDFEVDHVSWDLVSFATQIIMTNDDGQLDGLNGKKLADKSESLLVEEKRYRQIQVVDHRGSELVRIVRQNGAVTRVSDAELQNVAHEYGFQRAIVRNHGEVTVSLAVEGNNEGDVEQPSKPVVRFATPIAGGRGEKSGIVTIDYPVSQLFEQLMRSYIGHGKVLLVGSDGSLLTAPISDNVLETGHENQRAVSFVQLFPGAWVLLGKTPAGQFRNAEGLFIYQNILSERKPLPIVKQPAQLPQLRFAESDSDASFWKIVVHVPTDTLSAASHNLLNQLVLLDVFLFSVLLGGSYFIARMNIKKETSEPEVNHAKAERRDRDRSVEEGKIIAMRGSSPDIGDENLEFIECGNFEPFSLQIQNLDSGNTLAFKKNTAYYDPLTDLPNLTFFAEFLNKTIARSERYGETLGIFLVDLDDFHGINTTHGREIGNELLKVVAIRLAKSLRQSDFIARPSLSEIAHDLSTLAVDQFFIMLHEIKRIEHVAKIAERILKDVSMPVHLGDIELSITCSIGISILPDDGRTIDSLVEKANIAMRHAKHGGKHGYSLHGSIISDTLLTADSESRSS